eukprot:459607-Pyramimonas_sp.AAC.1
MSCVTPASHPRHTRVAPASHPHQRHPHAPPARHVLRHTRELLSKRYRSHARIVNPPVTALRGASRGGGDNTGEGDAEGEEDDTGGEPQEAETHLSGFGHHGLLEAEAEEQLRRARLERVRVQLIQPL